MTISADRRRLRRLASTARRLIFAVERVTIRTESGRFHPLKFGLWCGGGGLTNLTAHTDAGELGVLRVENIVESVALRAIGTSRSVPTAAHRWVATMETKIKKYWERNGKRRPFPSLYEAAEMYGVENVIIPCPRYEKENQCPWCGGEVNNPRRRYCSDECRQKFADMTVWHRGRDPYSLRILFRDDFTCQDCGEFFAYENEHGMRIPIDNGLEVHHIVPVSEGGGDEPSNLVTLCLTCHRERHRQEAQDVEAEGD